MKSSLIIVSNRLPITVKKVNDRLEFHPSIGGLATGLSSYVKGEHNKWVGWPGLPSDGLTEDERQQISDELLKHNCYPIFLTQQQLDVYYNGYSNTLLWPLLHDLPTQLKDHDQFLKTYQTVNRLFCDAVLAESDPNSMIWVHDYQLFPLPAMLRVARPQARIGFFLHIPFPDPSVFTQLPSANLLLAGVLGSDLIGLHTKGYVRNFLKLTDSLNPGVVDGNQVILGERVVQVAGFPIGIDYKRFARARELKAVKREVKKHRQKYKGMKVILAVDRLDPTKGIVERLNAYEEFLHKTPRIRGKIVLAMLAAPSRTEIDEYKQLKVRAEGLIASINSEFGTPSWQPIDYMPTSLSVESVAALYQVADIAFVTPIRDGMNLVAKEYIASKPKGDGVLILSETAGAAQELTEALLVNPKDQSSMVAALKTALAMPKSEMRQRLNSMHAHIATHTIQSWAKVFIETLQKPAVDAVQHTRPLTKKHEQHLVSSFHLAKQRTLLLDYDGVLTPIVETPEAAVPSEALYTILRRLTSDQATQVVIISGRHKDDLQKWFGELPLTLIAEHGAFLREANHQDWIQAVNNSNEWQADIKPILEKYVAKTPGAFVETKKHSLVWHYRKSSPYYAQKSLMELERVLGPYAQGHSLAVRFGKKILEVKPHSIHKGIAALNQLQSNPDFVLSIGDDYTDEDMFTALPATAYTIKVGRGTSAARFRVADVDQVHALLNKLTK